MTHFTEKTNIFINSIQFQSNFHFKECFSFFSTEKIEEIVIPKRIKRFVSFLIEEVILYLNGLYKHFLINIFISMSMKSMLLDKN